MRLMFRFYLEETLINLISLISIKVTRLLLQKLINNQEVY